MLTGAFGGVLMIKSGYFAIKPVSFGKVDNLFFAKYAKAKLCSKTVVRVFAFIS